MESTLIRQIGRYEFSREAAINPHRGADGRVLTYEPAATLAQGQLNPYGRGPFCKFSLPALPGQPGVYAVTVGTKVKYVRKCRRLSDKWGSSGYGRICRQDCLKDGRNINCRINAHIAVAANAGKVELWFHPTDDGAAVEKELIETEKPAWNVR